MSHRTKARQRIRGGWALKRTATLAGVGTAALAMTIGSAGGHVRAAADGPSGVHLTPLSAGTIGASVDLKSAGIRIKTKGAKDMLVAAITVDPGGSFGWHTHPGPVLVAVSKGTLDVYDATKKGCAHSTVTAGTAFVEGGGHVHLARNEGTTPVELNATFLAKHGTKDYLLPAAKPATCHV